MAGTEWEWPETGRPRLAPRCPRCKADLGRHLTTCCVVCRRVLHVDCHLEAGCPCQGARRPLRLAPGRSAPRRDVAALLIGVGLSLVAAGAGRWWALSAEPPRVVASQPAEGR